MDIDKSEFIDDFIEDMNELMGNAEISLKKLEEGSNQDLINELFRVAHSIKGMSASMEFVRMEMLTHKLEDLMYIVRDNTIPFSKEILDIVPQKSKKEKIVTFLGRITMQKGPEYFVEAAAMVLHRTKNIRFVMAGNGDMMNQMISLVAERGIADRFHFPGGQQAASHLQFNRVRNGNMAGKTLLNPLCS